MKRLVLEEINRLVKLGYLEPVDIKKVQIQWVLPVVILIKKNGNVRLCADFKITMNPYIKNQLHILPTLEETFVEFNGFTEFSIVDLKDAYFQFLVHRSYLIYLVIVTEWGYYWFPCMSFSITFGQMVFQNYMDSLLSNIEGVIVVQVDIGLGGKNRPDYLRRPRSVLGRLQEA